MTRKLLFESNIIEQGFGAFHFLLPHFMGTITVCNTGRKKSIHVFSIFFETNTEIPALMIAEIKNNLGIKIIINISYLARLLDQR